MNEAAEILAPIWHMTVKEAEDHLAFALRVFCDAGSLVFERRDEVTVGDAVKLFHRRRAALEGL